jgi:hypothetical protein
LWEFLCGHVLRQFRTSGLDCMSLKVRGSCVIWTYQPTSQRGTRRCAAYRPQVELRLVGRNNSRGLSCLFEPARDSFFCTSSSPANTKTLSGDISFGSAHISYNPTVDFSICLQVNALLDFLYFPCRLDQLFMCFCCIPNFALVDICCRLMYICLSKHSVELRLLYISLWG